VAEEHTPERERSAVGPWRPPPPPATQYPHDRNGADTRARFEIAIDVRAAQGVTDPTAHGADASDAFHVVIPSMPGYGYSGKPATTGWGPGRVARAYTELMKRLGYTRFVAQGGDWGAIVVDLMGVQAPPELLGIHTNMPGVFPPGVDGAVLFGHPLPADLSDEEKKACEQLAHSGSVGGENKFFYAFLMGTRPETLTGLTDSPVGLATFMIDHDHRSMVLISRAFAGQPEGLTRDDVLDNISHFWLTDSGVSASRMYWEGREAGVSFFDAKGVRIPVAVSVFPDELYQAPRSWSEQAYPNLIHYNRVDKGGHFAAWEQPQLLSEEVRAGFRSLR
jgi:pimeloyl-ACP methyl ester carboxylesterase